MRYFKYLERQEFAKTWIEGGFVPINPASAYYSSERGGKFTPDELMQRSLVGPMQRLIDSRVIGIQQNTNTNITMRNCRIIDPSGVQVIDYAAHLVKREDSYIDCYSTELSSVLSKELKRDFVVEIVDVESLARAFDQQVGIDSVRGVVDYTDGYERSHFVKSVGDSWQKEFRLVWMKDGIDPLFLEVPPGLCVDRSRELAELAQ